MAASRTFEAVPVAELDLEPAGTREECGGRWAAAAGAGVLLAAGAGAGLMYLFDPDRGRARRHKIRDQAASAYHKGVKAIEGAGEDAVHRVEGTLAEARRMLSEEDVSDVKLIARVRSKLGRLTRKPHSIEVFAEDGVVTLRGEVPATDAGRVQMGVALIPGVKDVRLEWTPSQTAEASCAFTPRALAAVAGGALCVYALRSLRQ